MNVSMSNVRLITLGGLRLEPKGFQRPKLLLLLTYLALEHGRSRDHLRSLFWSGAANASSSLRVALAQLRQSVPNALEESGQMISTPIRCDVVELLEALDAGDWALATTLYTGAFLDGFLLPDWSAELEEWVYQQRELIAG